MFAALALPSAALSELAAVIPAPPAGARVVPPRRWHLTLAFYGEVAQWQPLQDALQRRLPQRGPVHVQVRGGGVFHGGAAHVAVTGVADPDAALLRDLAEACRRAGLACGAPGTAGRERFRPHLTVARFRRGALPPPDYRDALQGVAAGPWEAAAVELVESFLGPEPSYEVRRRFPLVR